MDPLRSELLRLLNGGGAHADFARALENFNPSLRGVRKGPHSGWELLEHLRISQHDMLQFSRDPNYQSPKWPDGYWPASPEPPSEAGWDNSVASFKADIDTFKELIADPKQDLALPFPHGDGQSLLREALQLADHNSYHLGELIFLRRLLNDW